MSASTSVDLRVPGYDVFPSSVDMSITFPEGVPVPELSFTLDGAAAVERGAAKISGKKFVIPTKMLALDHKGIVDALGGPVSLSLRPGVPLPAGELKGVWNKALNAPDFPIQSIFRGISVRLETTQGSFDLDSVDVSANITGIPPLGSQYAHPTQVKVTTAGIVVGKARAIHKVKNGNRSGEPGKDEICSSPCCSVHASGHCSCFFVRDQDGLKEQVLFAASHPGVARSPVGEDRVLAYETITNQGPRAVRVFWDGPPPSYETPGQSALLLPHNSITIAASRAVKVVYSPDPQGLTGEHAQGYDVISWCCPEPWVSRPEE